MDITLTCKSCGKKFLFTQGEIQYYKLNGLTPPKKCPSCRKNPYADLHSDSSKLGMSLQNIEDNPANHAGFFPVGYPAYEGFSLKHGVVTVEINNRWYYVRVERIKNKQFVILFLTSDERATVFSPEFDLQYILNLLSERSQIVGHEFKIQRHKIQYSPKIVGWDDDVETLKKLKHSVDWWNIQIAQIDYKEYWRRNIVTRLLNLEEI